MYDDSNLGQFEILANLISNISFLFAFAFFFADVRLLH